MVALSFQSECILLKGQSLSWCTGRNKPKNSFTLVLFCLLTKSQEYKWKGFIKVSQTAVRWYCNINGWFVSEEVFHKKYISLIKYLKASLKQRKHEQKTYLIQKTVFSTKLDKFNWGLSVSDQPKLKTCSFFVIISAKNTQCQSLGR